MQVVERHVISKNDPRYAIIDTCLRLQKSLECGELQGGGRRWGKSLLVSIYL
jgi:hypothetical protein